MTEAEAERAGRALCQVRGIDPEYMVAHGPLNGSGAAVCYHTPQWRYLWLTELRPLRQALSVLLPEPRNDA